MLERQDEMSEQDQSRVKQVFRRPDEAERTPLSDQARYEAYWNERELDRRRREREEWGSLNVYERARRKYPNSF